MNKRVTVAILMSMITFLILMCTWPRMSVPIGRSTAQPESAPVRQTEINQRSTQYSKIYFLKTHKTASSVIENILMR